MDAARNDLRMLSDIDDLEVAPGEPDVRGWDVVLGDDTEIGQVDDLIVDSSAMKVQYLVVDLDKGAFNLADDRRVLVPVGQADLDVDQEQVCLPGLKRESILALPDPNTENWNTGAWDTGAWDTATTGSLEDTIARAADQKSTRLTRSVEELRIGKRKIEAGEVRIGKHVETEHVSQPVARERERVVIDRRPASAGARGDASTSESGEVRVPVVEEELVVEKRPVVKEELVIAKEGVSETERVEADVRREVFDIDKTGRVDVSETGNPGAPSKGER
jgi:uncharacterized protein (TIGR02271 family)